MAHFLISAANKSSGKTILSVGISAAMHNKGLTVQSFKKGPDYIDPMWLSKATRRNCYNLDFWTQSKAEIESMFVQKSMGADISIIEGNKGLHDGLAADGSNSNAALAKLLKTPVILVLDTRGTIRGVAPLVLGYQQFDPAVNIAGVILNFVGGGRHAAKLTTVLERYTDIPILGIVQRIKELELTERYLGLMPSNEDANAEKKINQIAASVTNEIDIENLVNLANTSPNLNTKLDSENNFTNYGIKLAYAFDEAFGFYYADDLESFKQYGVQLIPFDTLQDEQLPVADALFIGGGFPEKRMHQLSANTKMKQAIATAIEQGMPTYAECGGLMYLSKSIKFEDQYCNMVGVIDADCEMFNSPIGRGYTLLENYSHHPWLNIKHHSTIQEYAGHEFHYSKLTRLADDTKYAFRVNRGYGVNGNNDGIVYKNLLACYAHQRNTQQNQWIPHFLNFIKASA